MPDNRFDGKKVSSSWDWVLTRARHENVRFTLDSGRRTMREQWALYNAHRRDPAHTPVAAFPSPLAPHIRTGRQDHAIDVNSNDGGETRLQRWLEGKGVHPANTVAGEPWHLEVPRRELAGLARRYKR